MAQVGFEPTTFGLLVRCSTNCATEPLNFSIIQLVISVLVIIIDVALRMVLIQHKVVTQFLDMCLSTSSTADGIFTSIDNVFVQNELSWNNCISLGVDNTSVNIGKHHSLITKAREKNSDIILMGCPCHMAHNTAQHAVKMFEGCLKDFNIEELLVDIYCHFDYSSKRKNLL